MSPDRAEGLYRRLLWLLPAGFRREAEAELVGTFRDARARVRNRSLLARGLFWPKLLVDLLVTAVAERNVWRPGDLLRDARLGVRSLARTPGFTAAAFVTCALGLGVNLAVLSIVDRMMFRPFPYGEPDRLVQVYNRRASAGAVPYSSLSNIVVGALRTRSRSIDDIAVVQGDLYGDPMEIVGLEAPLQLDSASWNLLQVLKVAPVAGRDFTREDLDSPEQEILLTDEAWARRFGRSSDVFSRTLPWVKVESRPFRIVGILPPGFLIPASAFGARSEGIRLDDREDLEEDLGNFYVRASAVARLRGETSVAEAQAEVDVLMAQVLPLVRDTRPEWIRDASRSVKQHLGERPVQVAPLRSGLFFAYRSYAALILAGVGAVFLVACVNLATLFLARGRAREHDSAVRAALGASRGRLVRGAVIEAAVLCLASATLAVAACYATYDAVMAVVPLALRGVAGSPLDLRLLGFTVAGALAAATVAGAWPALRAARADVVQGLRRQTRSSSVRLRGSGALLTVEAALGVLLVAGAAVTVQNLLAIVLADPGYRAEDLYDVDVAHGGNIEPRTSAMADRATRVVDILKAVPGIAAVGAVADHRLSVGYAPPVDANELWRSLGAARGRQVDVGPGYLDAIGARLFAGREIERADLDPPAAVVVLNRRGVAHLWPEATPAEVIGRAVATVSGPLMVVGVIEDVLALPGADPIPEMFRPLTASASEWPRMIGPDLRFALRMAPGRTPEVGALEAALDAAMGARWGEPDLERIADALPAHLQRPRFQALLFGSVGVIALLLAAVGLYAVTAFEAARRRFEVGVRMSLGATAGDVLRLIVGQSLRPVLAGTAAGLLLAWWAAPFLQEFVQIDARGVQIFGVVTVVFVATVVTAAWLPARRASRTDPSSALREA